MPPTERRPGGLNGPGVLHLGKYYPPEAGGIEYVVKSFAEATRTAFPNYCLVASKRGPSRVETPCDGIVVHLLKEWGTLLLTPVLPSLPPVLHRLRKTGAWPIILLHYPNPMTVFALCLSLIVRPKREKVVVWYHADTILGEWWKRAIYSAFRPVEEYVFRRADAFVAATPHHVRQSPTLHRFRDRCAILPFCLPDRWFDVTDADRAEGKRTRERLGGKFLLFVGRLVPYKGLDTVVRAAGKIDCRIVLIGSGPLRERLLGEIRSRGLEEKVLLLGPVDDLRPYYMGCEFLLLPSCSELEAFGIVQIEAMALGKPVVSSDLKTGVTYVNRDGETGLTFPVGDADAFAAACNRLLRDEGLRSGLGEFARARAVKEFSYAALREAAALFFGGARGGNPP